MGRSLIVDLDGTFGYLLRGLLRGAGHQAALAESLEAMSASLRLHYHDVVFLGDVPDSVLELLAELDGLRLVQIGSHIGLEEFCDEVLERPLRLGRLSQVAGKLLVACQRRIHRRRPVELPVDLQLGRRRLSGRATDLGVGGLRLALDATDLALDAGQRLQARLGLPGDELGLTLRVAYSQTVDGSLSVGLGFTDLGSPAAGRLADYLLCA